MFCVFYGNNFVHAFSLLIFTLSCAFFHIGINLGLLQTYVYISARIIRMIDNGECNSISIIGRASFSLFWLTGLDALTPIGLSGEPKNAPDKSQSTLWAKKISLLAFVSQQGYLLILVSGSPWLTILHLYNSRMWATSSDSSATASSTSSSMMQKSLVMAATSPGMAHTISFRWW